MYYYIIFIGNIIDRTTQMDRNESCSSLQPIIKKHKKYPKIKHIISYAHIYR